MAVLSEAERVAAYQRFMSDASSVRALLSLTKAELRAAINAVDDWADSNASEFNQALPVAARTALTAKQKAMLLAYVILRRYEVA